MASQRDDIRSVLIEMFAVSDAMNQLLLAHSRWAHMAGSTANCEEE